MTLNDVRPAGGPSSCEGISQQQKGKEKNPLTSDIERNVAADGGDGRHDMDTGFARVDGSVIGSGQMSQKKVIEMDVLVRVIVVDE